MKDHTIGTSVLLALLLSAGLATAQTTATPTYESAVTTGIVTMMPQTQTAQLNVLNTGSAVAVATSSPGSTTPPVVACPVELEFRDTQNNVLKSMSVSNLAPGTAATLTMKISDLPAVALVFRLGIRGVVKSNPFNFASFLTGGMPVIAFSSCSVLPTLELFDTSTGITQTLVSDTRPFGTPVVVPLAIKN